MRFGIVPASIFEGELNPDAIALYACLTTYASKNGICWPSQAELSQCLNRSQAWVSAAISQLEKNAYIRVERVKGSSSRYYLTHQHTDNTDQPADMTHQYADTEQYQEQLNNKKKAAHRLPDDFQCDEKTWNALTTEYGIEFDIEEQLKAFCDYWWASGSKTSKKVNWNAAFRSWMRNARRFKDDNRQQRSPNQKLTTEDRRNQNRERLTSAARGGDPFGGTMPSRTA
jgi:hypothetical protein